MRVERSREHGAAGRLASARRLAWRATRPRPQASNTPSPDALETDYFAVHRHSGCANPANWEEERITDASFDMRDAPYARRYFLGDYMGLASAGNDFISVFGQAFAQNDASQYFSRLSP